MYVSLIPNTVQPNIYFIPFSLSASDCMVMHETHACAPAWLFLDFFFLFLFFCVSYCALRLHKRASRHVSGLPGLWQSFSLSDHPRSFSTAPTHTHTQTHTRTHTDPPARISAPRCVTNTSARMDGWMHAWIWIDVRVSI